jgi:hypothetical protein
MWHVSAKKLSFTIYRRIKAYENQNYHKKACLVPQQYSTDFAGSTQNHYQNKLGPKTFVRLKNMFIVSLHLLGSKSLKYDWVSCL